MIRVLIASAAGMALFGLDSAVAQADTYDWMYESNTVAAIHLGLTTESREDLEAQPDEYVPATFAVNGPAGQSFGPVPVELRLKGSTSFRTLDGKAAFKLKFAKKDRPWGLKKMTLNNMVQDPTKVREAIAYELFRAMDVPASRTGYANVDVNGEEYGLYLNLETLDDQSMERWFESTGHLYEANRGADLAPDLTSFFEVDEGDEEDTSDLDAFVAAAGSEPSTWQESVGSVADLPEMIRMWATEAFIGHWDGYMYDRNNYYLHSNEEGRFSMLPSGADQAFFWGIELFGDDQGKHPLSLLFWRCMKLAACRAEYAAALLDARDQARQLELATRAGELYENLRPDLLADPRKEHPVEVSDQAAATVTAFLTKRDAQVDQVMRAVPEAPSGLEATPAPGAIDLKWDAARTHGAAPVTGYLVTYARAGSGSSTSLSVDEPGPGSLHIGQLRGGVGYLLTVRAVSATGLGEPAQLPAPVLTDPVSLESPVITGAPAGFVASTAASFTFGRNEHAVEEPAEEGGFECQIDRDSWQPCVSPVRYRSLGQGRHRFRVRQVDRAGNTSPSAGQRWTVDTVGPRILSARYVKRPGRGSRLSINATIETPALRLYLANNRHRPAPRSKGQGSRRFSSAVINLKQHARFRWVRLEDLAGNTSAWREIR